MTDNHRKLTNEQDLAVRDQVERVLASHAFKNKDRLHVFLRYIVEETLGGRAESIRGKNIAKDAFDREPSIGDTENVVRAHARRVRQCLGEYYRTEGARDTVYIQLETGSYVPSFEFGHDIASSRTNQGKRPFSWDWRQLCIGAAGGLAIATGAAVFVDVGSPVQGTDAQDERRLAQREAILSKSVVSLQAVNLAEQARAMIFPVFDLDRQKLVSQLFLRVVDLDPKFFGGFAGAAQSSASLAMLLRPGKERDVTLAQSKLLARRALEIAPTEAWTQSAVGWVALADRDYQKALEASRRAFQIDPDEGNVLDFYAGVALFSGEFSEAVSVADPKRNRKASNQRFAHRNIHGAANFHLGRFDLTVKSFQAAAALGEPLSVASLAYQAAALHGLGRKDEGRLVVKEMMQNWPKANIAPVFNAYYQDSNHAADIINRIIELGWSPS